LTYSAKETSSADGQPLLLFHFSIGPLKYLYNTSDVPVTYSGSVYEPGNLSSSSIRQASGVYRENITISTTKDLTVLELFLGRSLPTVMTLTIHSKHDSDAEVVQVWQGRVVGRRLQGNQATISAESFSTIKKRTGISRKYGTSCPHFLFGSACSADINTYSHNTTVSSVDSNTALTFASVHASAAADDSYYPGGYIRYTDTFSLTRTVMITGYTSATKQTTFVHALTDVEVGTPITLVPGCDKALTTCRDKFGNNVVNFGGWPYSPNDNVFVTGA